MRWSSLALPWRDPRRVVKPCKPRLEETKNVEKRLPIAADVGDGTEKDDAMDSGDAGLGTFIVLANDLRGDFLDATSLAACIRTRMVPRWVNTRSTGEDEDQ